MRSISRFRLFLLFNPHAQYDGYSLSILSKDLKALSEDLNLPEWISYSVHLQHWHTSQINQEAADSGGLNSKALAVSYPRSISLRPS